MPWAVKGVTWQHSTVVSANFSYVLFVKKKIRHTSYLHGANDGAKKLQTTRKSGTKVVNTSFVPEFTTSFKLKCRCGIYHLFSWVPRSYHYFAVFYLCNLPYQLFLHLKGITIAHKAPVHTYPDIFLKRRFSPPFSKQIRVESFSPVHTKTLNNGKTIASLPERELC